MVNTGLLEPRDSGHFKRRTHKINTGGGRRYQIFETTTATSATLAGPKPLLALIFPNLETSTSTRYSAIATTAHYPIKGSGRGEAGETGAHQVKSFCGKHYYFYIYKFSPNLLNGRIDETRARSKQSL